jgi:mRNA-degrading endonuclease toxin of MazEF toxin-antitoxin module
MKSIDWKKRKARYIASLPELLLREALAKARTLLTI